MDGARSAALLAAAIGLLTLAGPVMAAEVSGNARVIGGTVESDGSESGRTRDGESGRSKDDPSTRCSPTRTP